eukprot:SM000086S23018  [mRNA]  locus=s86:173221:173922:+ [translate_table: standard]
MDMADGTESEWRSPEAGVRVVRDGTRANAALVIVDGLLNLTLEAKPIAKQYWTPRSCFAHLDIGFEFGQLSGLVEGALGQMFRKEWAESITAMAEGAVFGAPYVLHEVEPYLASSLGSPDCPVSTYSAAAYDRSLPSGSAPHTAALTDGVQPAGPLTQCFHDHLDNSAKCIAQLK